MYGSWHRTPNGNLPYSATGGGCARKDQWVEASDHTDLLGVHARSAKVVAEEQQDGVSETIEAEIDMLLY